ncbi:Sister chromatid cohesion protein SCC4 [Sesamum angolense]|uniref:Sister chromatid cohesion protein SCC4 n=1 Tax=Sesamum angolense TaxID=2727404 RepID=A0AAE1XBB5_9LAMI|nr:Sister chromatid cohesion protein SCC4 [Sesamum angolense]
MEAVAEGLWALAEHHEQKREIGKAVKCFEAICQSPVSFLPIIEIKTRLRVAALLLKHSHNVNHAKAHLERSQLLLKSIPSCFELKCRAYSLLSQCYHLVGAIPSQKQILNKGLELTAVSGDGVERDPHGPPTNSIKLVIGKGHISASSRVLSLRCLPKRFAGGLWSCNFNSQLANALIIEGDYNGSILSLQQGFTCAVEMCYPELQASNSVLFYCEPDVFCYFNIARACDAVDSTSLVEESVNRCNVIWESIEPEKPWATDELAKNLLCNYPVSALSCSGMVVWDPCRYPLLPILDTPVTGQFYATCRSVTEIALNAEIYRQHCLGLLFYHELLQLFYLLRICDYKTAAQRIDKLDAAMKFDMERMQHIRELTNELDVLNHSLSRSDLNYKDRTALAEKQSKLEERLSNYTGMNLTGKASLEPAYFGNVKRAWPDKLELAPPPIDGEWLPKSAVYALVDLMVVVFSRPKGLFKECQKRIQSGLQTIQEELLQLGITDRVKGESSIHVISKLYGKGLLTCFSPTYWMPEVELQHSAIWMAGVYLMLLMQFLENKVAIDLTRTEFVEAQEALVQMRHWFVRFPTILQACESTIEMLRANMHILWAAIVKRLSIFLKHQSKSTQAMSQIYAAVSFICISDAESSAKAVDLIGPVLGVIDSFVGVREKTCALYTYGFLLMRQQNLQEARKLLSVFLHGLGYGGWFHIISASKSCLNEAAPSRFFTYLKAIFVILFIFMTFQGRAPSPASFWLADYTYLPGKPSTCFQYLTVLGNLALALHDTGQAREILRSALTLSKKLYDIPTQNWVLSNLTALYQQSGEKGSEMENLEYQRRKIEDLQQRLATARSSVHHNELIEKVKLQVQQLNEHDMKRAIAGPSKSIDLDIPESVGLLTPQPMPSSARLMDQDIGRLRKRRV